MTRFLLKWRSRITQLCDTAELCWTHIPEVKLIFFSFIQRSVTKIFQGARETKIREETKRVFLLTQQNKGWEQIWLLSINLLLQINTKKREELIKLRDSIGTRTNGYKWIWTVVSNFRLEIRFLTIRAGVLREKIPF